MYEYIANYLSTRAMCDFKVKVRDTVNTDFAVENLPDPVPESDWGCFRGCASATATSSSLGAPF